MLNEEDFSNVEVWQANRKEKRLDKALKVIREIREAQAAQDSEPPRTWGVVNMDGTVERVSGEY